MRVNVKAWLGGGAGRIEAGDGNRVEDGDLPANGKRQKG